MSNDKFQVNDDVVFIVAMKRDENGKVINPPRALVGIIDAIEYNRIIVRVNTRENGLVAKNDITGKEYKRFKFVFETTGNDLFPMPYWCQNDDGGS